MRFLSCVMFLLFFSVAGATEELDLTEGSTLVTGSAQLHINTKDITNSSRFSVDLGGNVSVNYFVMDYFAVGLFVGGNFPVKIAQSKIPEKNADVGLQGIYFFNVNLPIYPYMGTGFSADWQFQNGVDIGLGWQFQSGILLGLNSYAAIDLGLRNWMRFSFTGDPVCWQLGVGYLGMVALF